MIKALVLACIFLSVLCIYLYLMVIGQNRVYDILKKDYERILGINELAYQMILIDVERHPLRDMIQKLNPASIAVYGMGELGERIVDDLLLNTSINVLYGMDKNACDKRMIIPVYTLEEAKENEKPEIILLTTFTRDDRLKKLIEKEMETKVYSLEEIIYEQ